MFFVVVGCGPSANDEPPPPPLSPSRKYLKKVIFLKYQSVQTRDPTDSGVYLKEGAVLNCVVVVHLGSASQQAQPPGLSLQFHLRPLHINSYMKNILYLFFRFEKAQ